MGAHARIFSSWPLPSEAIHDTLIKRQQVKDKIDADGMGKIRDILGQ